HFSRLPGAVFQRLPPLATHANVASPRLLREARRCERGNRIPDKHSCQIYVHTKNASISLQVATRTEATQPRGSRHGSGSASLQACVQCFEGTVTKLSSPHRTRETPS